MGAVNDTLPIYEHPALYEACYEGAYPHEIPFYHQVLRRFVPAGGQVLELAAGSGRVAIPLARLGWCVTGIDHNPTMLRFLAEYAKRECLPIGAILGDLRNLPQWRRHFHAVVSPLGVAGMVWEAEAAADLHRRLASALLPGGIILHVLCCAEDSQCIASHEGTWRAQSGEVATESGFRYAAAPELGPEIVRFVFTIAARRGPEAWHLRDEGVLRVATQRWVEALQQEVTDLEFLGWLPLFDAAQLQPAPPPGAVAAAALWRNRA